MIVISLNDSQQRTLNYLQQGIESTTELAELTGLARRTIREHKAKIKHLSAQGKLPEYFHTPAPPGHIVQGTSTYKDGQWIKTSLRKEQQIELIRAYVEGMVDRSPMPEIQLPKHVSSEWVNAIVLADLHLGLECYPEYGGKAWNIAIAEQTIMAGIETILEDCEPADTCWIANLGDISHSHDYKRATPQSGHMLDQDGPYSRTQHAVGRLFKWLVLKCLEKHNKVVVVNVPGNHDPDVATWVDVLTVAVFGDDSRVVLSEPDGAFHHLRHGDTYVMAAHGDKPRSGFRDLGDIMVNHDNWAGSKIREVWTGHVHSDNAKTLRNGIHARSFTTPIPVDMYAHSQGYRTNQLLHRVSIHENGRQKTDSVRVNLFA